MPQLESSGKCHEGSWNLQLDSSGDTGWHRSCSILPCTSGSLVGVCEDKPHGHSAPALKDIAIAVTLTHVHIAPPPLASSAPARCVPPTQSAVIVSPGGSRRARASSPSWALGRRCLELGWKSAECFLSSHLSLVALGWPISVSLPAPCPGSSECPALAWPPALPWWTQRLASLSHTPSRLGLRSSTQDDRIVEFGAVVPSVHPRRPALSLSPICWDFLKAEPVSVLTWGAQKWKAMERHGTWNWQDDKAASPLKRWKIILVASGYT